MTTAFDERGLPPGLADAAAAVIRLCAERGLTLGTAESLTGGLVASTLIATPGASAVVRGGVVAYDTRIKASVLGVDAELLARQGAVDPEVARQMALGVRHALAVDGVPADVGVATTGVAGPDPQDGHPPGLVYVAVALGDSVLAHRFELEGDRQDIRWATVSESLSTLQNALQHPSE